MAKNKNKKRKTRAGTVATPKYYLPPARHKQVTQALKVANQLLAGGKIEQTLELCHQLAGIEPRNAEVQLLMAAAHEQSLDIPAANLAYKQSFKLVPNFLPAMVNYAQMFYRAGQLENALKAFNNALSLDPDFVPALDGVARTNMDLRRYKSSVPLLEKLCRLRGGQVDYAELAKVQDLAGKAAQARKTYAKTVSMFNDKANISIQAGIHSLTHGDQTSAIEHFLQALEYDQNNGFAHYHLARTEPSLDRLNEIQSAITRTTEKSVANVQAPLHFAKGYLLEKSGDFEQAFDSFKLANALVASTKPDDNYARAEQLKAIQTAFTAEKVAQISNGKFDESKRPVFVTGLPRSGTTLVEQIIARHSDATGLGEVELIPLIFPRSDNPTSADTLAAAKSYRKIYNDEHLPFSRVIDKSISSLLYLGAIMAMFPNASIICCERHPMDVAWSAFKQYFNDGSLAYTYSFDRLARHQKIYAQALEHWQSEFPDKVLRVKYEELVIDPEVNSKKLISHLGLDWQENCLSFYKDQGPIRTASYAQVRQPIYQSSINSWKNYEFGLTELLELLKMDLVNYEEFS